MFAAPETDALLLPLDSNLANLENSGGKGAGLARLAWAGYAAPRGFILTTQAYTDFVSANHILEQLYALTERMSASSTAALEMASVSIREWFMDGEIPSHISYLIRHAYEQLGPGPLAVRSSATAEDLPDLSFAGQQDTYLNVIGAQALEQAVIACWSSLWTARAMGYRARNQVRSDGLKLAVVIQQMVSSDTSGILFTANPLSGARNEVVVNASYGLGEAIVSGKVDPDQYVVDPFRRRIISKRLGMKAVAARPNQGGGVIFEPITSGGAQALPDERIMRLAELGKDVERRFREPQDIEWAWVGDSLYLLQSRPITSLYPLPEGMPPEPLEVMVSFGAVQGMLAPMSTLGRDILGEIFGSGAKIFGFTQDERSHGPLVTAGERLFIRITPILRNRVGRKIIHNGMGQVEPGILSALMPLFAEEQLAPGKGVISPKTALRLARMLLPTLGNLAGDLMDPDAALQKNQAIITDKIEQYREIGQGDQLLSEQLAHFERIITPIPRLIIQKSMACVGAGVIALNIVKAMASNLPGMADLGLEVARGLPHNVTTEMDLALWQTAQRIRMDSGAYAEITSRSTDELVIEYRLKSLPTAAQDAIHDFLNAYGMRGVGEIDIGRPRWFEDPSEVIQSLQSYLNIPDGEQSPDRVFARGAQTASASIDTLVENLRSKPGGWWRVRLVRWAASRVRALAGFRESPKFFAINMMGIFRNELLKSGRKLVNSNLLSEKADIFYFYLDELRELGDLQLSDGSWPINSKTLDLAHQVARRIEASQRETLRKQIPRVLLSDGRAYFGDGVMVEAGSASLSGSPVSPGVAEGRVRIVLDPHAIQLTPGEILVCPGTDPAWTPLFLSAGGLVMEVGGLMTHGSVVAREYGIPAIAGVQDATLRLKNGQHVRVDGTLGLVTILAGGEL